MGLLQIILAHFSEFLLIRPRHLFLQRTIFLALLSTSLSAELCIAQVQMKDMKQQRILIAAASDVRYALDLMIANYFKETGQAVKVSYGSSGNFYQQVMQGGDYDILMMADEQYIFRLSEQRKTIDRGVVYGQGRLVLFIPKPILEKWPNLLSPNLSEFGNALKDGRIRSLAIANPAHAPYGVAAEQTLKSAQLWEIAVPKLILGENASQATQFAISGSVQGGLIPLALAKHSTVQQKGGYVLIPPSAHLPLIQRMALSSGASSGAKEFYAYLQTEKSQKIFKEFGFE
ncbi:MAG: molybdate transporter, periplasmic molybdate-binding protein [Pseudomonadota bacterium]|jgi:molybdate transport system substrate-binding protein